MRKIIYQVWISLDGYAADANHATKFFEDPKYGEVSDQDLLDYMNNIDTVLLGANTYKMFVEFWPTQAAENEIMAESVNNTPKIVFSKSLKEAPWGKWEPASIESGDAIAAIKKLKSQNGKSMVLWGSLSLAKSLMKENLVDELHIRIVPVVLGKGTSLFENAGETTLQLAETKSYPSGVVLVRYKPE